MLVTPHAVIGATIGLFLPRRAIALCAAVTSHFLLDTVPHWQETLPPYTPHRGTWIRVPIDVSLAAFLTWWVSRKSDDYGRVWCTALAGVMPDLDSLWFLAPDTFGRIGLCQSYVTWHVHIQRETSRLWGLAPQIGVMAICGAALRARRSKGS